MILYHITSTKNINNINKNGLLISKTGGGIYLFKLKDLESILKLLKNAYGNIHFALYKIDVSKDKVVLAEDGYRVDYGDINKKNVKFVKIL